MAMKIGTDKFKERVDTGINDSFMRGAVAGAQNSMGVRRQNATEELGNWEEWRSHGEEIRQHVLENLDYYLEQLSKNEAKRGGHVFFPPLFRRKLGRGGNFLPGVCGFFGLG